MQYVHLGRSGVKVSRLCLGTMNFGPETSEADSFAIMDRALELGLNFFDTANVYGWKVGEGWTEQIVGRWFAQGGGRREKVVLATKVFGRMGEWPNQSRLSALHIKRACEASLRRLQTDCIDLYQMHHVDRETPWEEIWQAMEQLVQEGKILYVGSSNFAGWHLAQAQELARSRHFLGLVSEQSLYNLNERTIELEVIPACEAYGIGLIPWSPLARGLLAGALAPAKVGRRADEDLKKEIEKYRPKLEAYDALCTRTRRAPGRCGARLAAAPEGRHVADYRTAHDGAIERHDARPESHVEPGNTETARRHLPRPRRACTRSLRLVTTAQPAMSCRTSRCPGLLLDRALHARRRRMRRSVAREAREVRDRRDRRDATRGQSIWFVLDGLVHSSSSLDCAHLADHCSSPSFLEGEEPISRCASAGDSVPPSHSLFPERGSSTGVIHLLADQFLGLQPVFHVVLRLSPRCS